METVTNAATTAANTVVNTATNLIYGTQQSQNTGTEPRSGETGSTSEPYDAGNVDGAPGNPGQSTTSTSTTAGATGDFGSTSGDTYSRSHSSNVDNDTSKASSNTYSSGPTTSSGAPGSQSTTANTNPASQTATGAVDGPGAITEQRGITHDETVGGFGTASQSVGADPSSGQNPEQKQQGADRPEEAPEAGTANTGGKKLSAEEEEQQRGERALKSRSPDDHSGEPLKMHSETGGDSEMRKTDRSQSIGQEGGGEIGKEKGTGEQYVKSSGLATDGGDFDASKPGAGREADRLLEEKGIKKSDDNKGAPQDLGSSDKADSGSGEKTSTITKLKEKLHIGSKKE